MTTIIKGKVILKDDLIFEGILTDSDAKSEVLVSGTLLAGKGAYFIMCSNDIAIWQMRFSGVSIGEEVVGSWTAYDKSNDYEAGEGEVIFREDFEGTVTFSKISERIEKFKAEMSAFSSNLYDSFVKNMNVAGSEIISHINRDKEDIEKKIGSTLENLKI